jgi:uncharacterized protein YdaU (DUF1376 family)
MVKSPAFQFYAADFLVGVMGMSDEEIGAYIKMLAIQWERGSLPENANSIKKLINSRKVPSDFLLEKFPLSSDGTRKNLRLEKEREKQASFRASRAVAGSAGGAKRAERIAAAKEKATHTKEEWVELRDFFEGCCICGKTEGICKDHIKPIYQGGSDGVENLQPLCHSCNSSKRSDSKDYRPYRALKIGKQMPSKWVARASEQTKQNVALQSSSSSSDNSTLSIPREEEVTEFASKQPGWEKDVVKQWFLDRSSQGWVKGSGVPITNWKADLEAWVLRQAQGNSPSGNQRGGRNQPQKPARTSKFAFEIPNHDDDEN